MSDFESEGYSPLKVDSTAESKAINASLDALRLTLEAIAKERRIAANKGVLVDTHWHADVSVKIRIHG